VSLVLVRVTVVLGNIVGHNEKEDQPQKLASTSGQISNFASTSGQIQAKYHNNPDMRSIRKDAARKQRVLSSARGEPSKNTEISAALAY
jgi:hypothetical protein